MTEFAHETRRTIDEEIDRLTALARDARAEAEHARHQPGLLGAQRNAEDSARAFQTRAAELREIALRVDRGFPYWEREGFEEAVDACGEGWRWQTLSEQLTSDHVRGDEDFDLRLPLDVQKAYARAAETNLFSRFEVCQTYDTDGEFVTATHSYLFGVQDFGHLGACYFLVEDWGESDG
jgi:hypothetical protein